MYLVDEGSAYCEPPYFFSFALRAMLSIHLFMCRIYHSRGLCHASVCVVKMQVFHKAHKLPSLVRTRS